MEKLRQLLQSQRRPSDELTAIPADTYIRLSNYAQKLRATTGLADNEDARAIGKEATLAHGGDDKAARSRCAWRKPKRRAVARVTATQGHHPRASCLKSDTSMNAAAAREEGGEVREGRGRWPIVVLHPRPEKGDAEDDDGADIEAGRGDNGGGPEEVWAVRGQRRRQAPSGERPGDGREQAGRCPSQTTNTERALSRAVQL